MPFKNIVILSLLSLLLLLAFSGRVSGQASTAIASSNLSARVLRLESDLFQARSQLNRLESQVARQGRRLESQRLESQRQSQTGGNPAGSSPSPPRLKPSEPTEEEQFDRLATLVIELKQQLEELEARVVLLESP
ncbi:MAG: hypothetical protein F6J93_06835 [Oscillatoria sp. SIO1A7]|nr:hypothetical protein [Oscillatoria sp. SIO1A7]